MLTISLFHFALPSYIISGSSSDDDDLSVESSESESSEPTQKKGEYDILCIRVHEVGVITFLP